MSANNRPRLAIDDGLLADAVTGDRRAVERLLALVQPAIIRYCRGRLATTSAVQSADDVAQEILLAVFAALHRYDGGAQAFAGFLFGIARNKVTDAYRARNRDKSTPVESLPETADRATSPDERVLRDELRSTLARHLNVLTEIQREALVLRLIVGLSPGETALAMGTSAGAVRVAQHRALKTLRRLLTSDSGYVLE
ncbi:sigma-70 family RNA polymerase sigma factor [Amycolatopsis sp.]|uniref:sigma-70 family RNA polymerase sigma factor n=1 Tax=Amycolatopsis sp. TaxID=37632 RepID=UPI002CC24714|nr:sigma-70 family RNA polymerase sigma factor [Amycolatopsis sp.]HVV12030.1 sigma-70 family RNA polymerase sigma factor [Amycolatopsis sp.]